MLELPFCIISLFFFRTSHKTIKVQNIVDFHIKEFPKVGVEIE